VSFETVGEGINNAGVIVGFNVSLAGKKVQGFIRTANGVLTNFSVPNASVTGLSGINDSGEIVGSYRDAAGLVHTFKMQANGSGFKSF
jgi:uncharacterized membrane protein